jgi:opacity protein-like surface antigen
MKSRCLFGLRALLVVVVLGGGAVPASADWLFTPYLGLNFGGSANFGDVGDFEDNFEKKAVFGGSLAWMGAGAVGVEFDLGVSPNFFAITTGDEDFDFGDSNLTTFMINAIVGAPLGGQTGPGVRPYVAGGVGLMRSHISPTIIFDDLDSTDFGINLGGGITGFFSDNVGIRGDIRYFRSLQDNEPDDNFDLGLSSFHFWRGTVGVTFRFGG